MTARKKAISNCEEAAHRQLERDATKAHRACPNRHRASGNAVALARTKKGRML